jgi:hypothetical protein
VLKRGALFAIWALLGAVLSYGALYVFTPFGLAIVVPTLLVAFLLPSIGGSRLPEALGLLAGPGLFCFLVAFRTADDPAAWTGAGIALIGAAVLAYVLVGRARCARSA